MNTRKKNTLQKSVMWMLIGIMVALVFPGVIGITWFPRCESCHLEQSESQEGFVHKDGSCISCHGGSNLKGRVLFRQHVMYSMVVPIVPTREPARAVTNESCSGCHDEVFAEGVVSNDGLKVLHKDCAKDKRCIICHGGIGHPESTEWKSRYAMDDCLACHEKNTLPTLTKCDDCHDGRMRRTRSARSTFALVHGSNWEQSHGLGDWSTCSPCHASTMCARCHGALVPHDNSIINEHGKEALSAGNKCAGCHRDQMFCDSCHGMEMPHPQGFLKIHKLESDTLGEAMCLRCHVIEDCTSCHRGHVHPGGPKLWNH